MNPTLNYSYDTSKEEFLYLKKRNSMLNRVLFDCCLHFRIIGNASNPAIIINNNTCLSSALFKYNLILKTLPKDGKEFAKLNFYSDKINIISDEKIDEYKRILEKAISECQHKKIYKIITSLSCGEIIATSQMESDNNYITLFLSWYRYNKDKTQLITSWSEDDNNSAIFFSEENANIVSSIISSMKKITNLVL